MAVNTTFKAESPEQLKRLSPECSIASTDLGKRDAPPTTKAKQPTMLNPRARPFVPGARTHPRISLDVDIPHAASNTFLHPDEDFFKYLRQPAYASPLDANTPSFMPLYMLPNHDIDPCDPFYNQLQEISLHHRVMSFVRDHPNFDPNLPIYRGRSGSTSSTRASSNGSDRFGAASGHVMEYNPGDHGYGFSGALYDSSFGYGYGFSNLNGNDGMPMHMPLSVQYPMYVGPPPNHGYSYDSDQGYGSGYNHGSGNGCNHGYGGRPWGKKKTKSRKKNGKENGYGRGKGKRKGNGDKGGFTNEGKRQWKDCWD